MLKINKKQKKTIIIILIASTVLVVSLYLSGLSANIVHVNNGGVGDITVNANNTLLVELTSLGNIIYSGNPVVTVSVHNGSGQLIKE